MFRWQKIKYTASGNAFVTHYGKHLPLDMFMRVDGGETITHKGKSLEIHGWYGMGYYASYGIHLSNCGEGAIVVFKNHI